jgi:cell division protein FtsZ
MYMTSLQFDLPKDQASIIKVFGVGGGGSNAVNHMFHQGIVGVNFVICNTDAQALEVSPIPNKIQLGPELTQGLGAGSNPEIGMQATEESIEELKTLLSKNTKMVFITAGMGGGTGTGGAPVIAKIAREMGILTVAIVTTPFSFEGKRKFNQALEGIEKLKKEVDTILVISNDKIREMHGNAKQNEAFNYANNILTTAAKSISEIITVPGYINVDFADVKYVMSGSGAAIMGSAVAEGEGRAMKAIQGALNSPLLNDNDIRGAKKILVNISSGSDQITIDEITEINEYIQDVAKDTDIIFGTCDDATLENKISVTLIATGFEPTGKPSFNKVVTKKVHELTDTPLEETPVANQVEEVVVEQKQDADNKVNYLEVEEEIKSEIPDLEMEHSYSLFTLNNANDETVSVEFEISSNLNQVEENVSESVSELPVVEEKVEAPVVVSTDEEFTVTNVKQYEPTPLYQEEKQVQELQDRKRILNQLSIRSLSRQNMEELESTPAYLRKNIELNSSLPSQEKNVSRFTLSHDIESDRPIIRRNNSFLDDNVD